jgi:hypothetical protein
MVVSFMLRIDLRICDGTLDKGRAWVERSLL